MTGSGLRLWARHPVRTVRAWLWLARQSAPAFDRASAERDRLRAARDAVRLALPGRARAVRRARAGVLRELNAGRLAPAAAVAASGLLTRPGVPELHRAALAAALGGSTAVPEATAETWSALTVWVRRSRRTGRAALAEIAAVRAALRTEIASVRASGPDTRAGRAPAVDRAALVAELADQIRDAISSGERWAPDYDALMKRTGFRRSWCEKAVRDARTQAFSAPQTTRTPAIRTPAPVPTRPPRRPSQAKPPGARLPGVEPAPRPGPHQEEPPSCQPSSTPASGGTLPAGLDTGDGEYDADVLFLPGRDPAPAPDGGNAATAGGPRRCRRPPVTSRTATSPTTMTTPTVNRS